MKTISTENAPAAIGPYSQAQMAWGLVFVSGQIPVVPATGEVAEGGISGQWLDEQALALNEFVTDYLMELSQNSGAENKARKAIIMKYCRASLNHAMFKDADKKESEIFVIDKKGYTPFCLNTNWVEALAEVKAKGKK